MPKYDMQPLNARPDPSEMTDREIGEETLLLMRAFAEMLAAVGSSPMAATMFPGLGKF